MTPPPCSCHGDPQYWVTDTRYTAGGYWRCSVKKRAENHSPAGRAAKQRYEQKRIRVDLGGTHCSYRIDPERKDELKAELARYRAARNQEVTVGRLDTSVSRA